MKFIKSFTAIFFLFLNLFSMEEKPQPCQSRLEAQIFGRRIRVENQSGIRFGIKVCRSDGQIWQSILENRASIDIGSLSDVPRNFIYEPYGNFVSHLYASQYGTIDLSEISKIGVIAENAVIVVKIKKSGAFSWGNDIKIDLECCRKNVIIQNLFPSVALLMIPGYIQGPCYRTIDEFKEKDCINFARYVLGLGKGYSEYDVNLKSARLFEEWNLELYRDDEQEIVQSIRSYIDWAKRVLLEILMLPESTRIKLEQMPCIDRNALIQIFEANARYKEQLGGVVIQAPIPPPPAMKPINVEADRASMVLVGCAGSPQIGDRNFRMASHVVKPEVLQIRESDISEMSKSLRHTQSSAPKAGLRGIQEISLDRWVELTHGPELIGREEMGLIRIKYESEEVDRDFLVNFQQFLVQVSDINKLGKLLNFLDKSKNKLESKKRKVLGVILSKLSRGTLRDDIHRGIALKKISK